MYLIGSQYNIRIFRIMNNLFYNALRVGYIKIDPAQKTTAKNVFACGDNVTRLRTVANAVAMGTFTGMTLNKELIEERF